MVPGVISTIGSCIILVIIISHSPISGTSAATAPTAVASVVYAVSSTLCRLIFVLGSRNNVASMGIVYVEFNLSHDLHGIWGASSVEISMSVGSMAAAISMGPSSIRWLCVIFVTLRLKISAWTARPGTISKSISWARCGTFFAVVVVHLGSVLPLPVGTNRFVSCHV